MINRSCFDIGSNSYLLLLPRSFPCVSVNCDDKAQRGFHVIALGQDYHCRANWDIRNIVVMKF